MSDARLYSRLILPKGHGYPLSRPQPFDDLPLDSRRGGIQTGDVGVVTSSGSFDVIFNICCPANDPANRFGIPKGFEQLNLGPEDVAPQELYHRPGSDVSNAKMSKRRLDVDASVDSNVSVLCFYFQGASRRDVRPLKNFRDYALQHAQRWYAVVNGDLGRLVDNDDLYLVTGTDKSASWSLA
ncbi:hypothetical protein B0H13DRAFT_1636935, partial [Mycena leptocephala]